MCGRYALSLRPSQIRAMLMDDGMPMDDYPADEGEGAPRQSYNFAPGYHGIVYRAATSDHGAGPPRDGTDRADKGEGDATATAEEQAPAEAEKEPVSYKMQSMKWGLIPFWTKRNPDYGSMLKTINCRDDSLSTSGGMWTTMKARKRCIVIAQGFFEWLKTGRDRLPHYIKRKDGHLMCFAGLWDCVQYEDSEEKLYSYTIITTDSNKQLKFLHDRMPVILEPGSEKLRMWLDPGRYEWSRDLQSLLKPFDGELEVYPVSKEVGKVGNNSPSFLIPIDSKENKSNIANFFANAPGKSGNSKDVKMKQPPVKPKTEADDAEVVKREEVLPEDKGNTATHKPNVSAAGEKRKAFEPPADDVLQAKKLAPTSKGQKLGGKKVSATRNEGLSPVKLKQGGSQKITKFFGNSA